MSTKFAIDVDKLICLVQIHSELYDSQHEFYKDFSRKLILWRTISSELHPEFFQMSTSQQRSFMKLIQKRWRNVKDNYAKELRKRRREERCGIDSTQRRTYVHFAKLGFLRPILELRRKDEEESQEDSNSEEEVPAFNSLLDITSESASSLVSEANVDIVQPEIRQRNVRRQPTRHHMVEDSSAALFGHMTSFMQQIAQERSPNYNFAVSMVPFLDRIRPELIGDAMKEVITVLQRYDYEKSCCNGSNAIWAHRAARANVTPSTTTHSPT